MTLSKLSPTKIVLSLLSAFSLMVSLSPPRVLTLDTGYAYETWENPTTTQLYGDLKCAYLMAGVTHMRLAQHIMADKTIPHYAAAVGLMINYDIRAVICTLYGVEGVEIGSLWLLLLYATTVQSIYLQRVAEDWNEARRAAIVDGRVAVHDYVTAIMQRELSAARCRPGNHFGWYEDRYERMMATLPDGQNKMYYHQTVGFDNCVDLNRLLKRNDARSTYGTRYEALWPRYMFITNLGVNLPLQFTLMNAYDVQISWGRAKEVLDKDFQNTFMMNSRTVNFLPLLSVKMYYNVVFALLKGIMCRLLWKCLLYADTCQGREEHLTKCRDFLMEFQHLLRLQDDPDIVGLLNRLSTSVVVVDDVINQIRLQLYNINVILQCVATNEPTLRSEQLVPLEPSSSNQTTSSHANDIVGTAKALIEDIAFAFQCVDFDVIKSIRAYVDQNYLLTIDSM